MLFELFTGELLFPTHDSYQHIAMILARLEKQIPWSMVINADKKNFFCDRPILEKKFKGYGKTEYSNEESTKSEVKLLVFYKLATLYYKFKNCN